MILFVRISEGSDNEDTDNRGHTCTVASVSVSLLTTFINRSCQKYQYFYFIVKY